MNAGRAPTPLGGDGIDPFVLLPHWFTVEFARELRSHRIAFAVAAGFVQRADSRDPDDHQDRLKFPGSDPAVIQALLDPLVARHRGG